MLRSCRKLVGYQVQANDGPVGHLYDLYFDDRSKRVIYAVVHIGESRRGLRVLVSPKFLGFADHDSRVLPVDLSGTEVASLPDWDSARPVYRQRTAESGLNFYASAGTDRIWDLEITRLPLVPSPFENRPEAEVAGESETGQSHIRSFREISGYTVCGADGQIGDVIDFVLGDIRWRLPYMVVETESCGVNRNVLIPTSSIRYISCDDRMILTDISQRLLRAVPYFESATTRS